jgi:hypothetical protein
MKTLLTVIFCLLFLSCSKNPNESYEPIAACGCDDVQKELSWLIELKQKTEADTTLTRANYWGCIWLEKTSDGKDIFVTNMMLGSGGILYWYFDCDGNHYAKQGVEICPACKFVGNKHNYDDFSISEVKKNIVVYSYPSNVPCK